MTEDKLNEILDDLQAMRKAEFGKDENIYRLLGSAMGKIMDVRLILREKIKSGLSTKDVPF